MDQSIKKILDDLYRIDPALQAHEAELIEYVRALLAARPQAQLDESFVQSLRQRLYKEIESLQSQPARPSLFTYFMSMKKMYIGAGIAVLAVLLVIPVAYKFLQPASRLPASQTQIAGISRIADGAFGQLNQGQLAQNSAETISARTQSGGGGASGVLNSIAPVAAPDMAVGLGGGGTGKMIAPYNPVIYKYVYKGELSAPADKLAVYKRVKGLGSSDATFALMRQLNFGLLNFSSFQNMELQSINLSENRQFGYSIYVDFLEGMISINQNWMKWQRPELQCQTTECFERIRIKESDIPEDAILISIANNFLKDHGISVESYGQPIVMNDWRVMYTQMPVAERPNYYFPESMSVIYPQMVDGQIIYDEGGSVSGLNVSIDVREKKVSGVWNLSTQKYESSMYAMETDTQVLMDFVSRGGMYSWYTQDDAKTVEVELGEPTLVLMRSWQFQNNLNDEIFVPAYVFPVLSQPEDDPYFYRKNVVVPLAKDILNASQRPPIGIMEKTVPGSEPLQTAPAPVVDTPAAY